MPTTLEPDHLPDRGDPLSLAGVRVGVVGHGDTLARVLRTLHGQGAQCVVLDDPYHAVAEIARKPLGTYGAVVLALPCLYPIELAAISALRTVAPTLRVFVAAAEQHVGLLAAAMRAGAHGLVTDTALELFAPATQTPPAPTPTPADNALLVDEQLNEDDIVGETVLVPDLDADDADDDSSRPGEFAGDFSGEVDPILTAEELAALLHGDFPDAPPSTPKRNRA